jgi:hypothetical protein
MTFPEPGERAREANVSADFGLAGPPVIKALIPHIPGTPSWFFPSIP